MGRNDSKTPSKPNSLFADKTPNTRTIANKTPQTPSYIAPSTNKFDFDLDELLGIKKKQEDLDLWDFNLETTTTQTTKINLNKMETFKKPSNTTSFEIGDTPFGSFEDFEFGEIETPISLKKTNNTPIPKKDRSNTPAPPIIQEALQEEEDEDQWGKFGDHFITAEDLVSYQY